jgi:hypothetical protein
MDKAAALSHAKATSDVTKTTVAAIRNAIENYATWQSQPIRQQVLDQLTAVEQQVNANFDLNRRIIEMESKSDDELEQLDDGFFWKNDDGPYCPKCYREHPPKTNRLRQQETMVPGFFKHVCTVCDFSVNGPKPKEWPKRSSPPAAVYVPPKP